MVVKSAKGYKTMVVAVFFAAIPAVYGIGDMVGGVAAVWLSAVLLGFIVFWILRFCISVGRTLIFDENGCTVKFLWFSKSFKWEELKTKKIVDLKDALGYRQPYTAGAMFSIRHVRLPGWLALSDYCVFVHPFEFIFVNFDTEHNYKKWDPPFEFYIVNEDEFMTHMEDWGVELYRT